MIQNETIEEFKARGGTITKVKSSSRKTGKSLTEVKKSYAFEAKPIIKGKFWILEQLGRRIGTLQYDELGYILSSDIKERFLTKKDLLKKYQITFMTKKELTSTKEKTLSEVHGFPCKGTPHNDMLDIKRNIPLYTKTDVSKSYYCAGYYVIRFEKLWSPNYCPKLITLNRYEFIGPFKTKTEQRSALKSIKDT